MVDDFGGDKGDESGAQEECADDGADVVVFGAGFDTGAETAEEEEDAENLETPGFFHFYGRLLRGRG